MQLRYGSYIAYVSVLEMPIYNHYRINFYIENHKTMNTMFDFSHDIDISSIMLKHASGKITFESMTQILTPTLDAARIYLLACLADEIT